MTYLIRKRVYRWRGTANELHISCRLWRPGSYLDRKTEHRRRIVSSTGSKTKYEGCVEKERGKKKQPKKKRRKGTAQASQLNSQAIQPTGPAVASPPFSRFLVMSLFSCAGTLPPRAKCKRSISHPPCKHSETACRGLEGQLPYC